MKPRKFNDLTKYEKEQLIQELVDTPNMSDFWHIVNNRFNLQSCIPGGVTKKIVSRSIVNLVLPMLNPYTNEIK